MAVLNTKFPEIGELLLHRVVTQVGLRCRVLPLLCCCCAAAVPGHAGAALWPSPAALSRLLCCCCCHCLTRCFSCHREACVADPVRASYQPPPACNTLPCASPSQFKRAYKRNDKPVCVAAIKFIAHLANQQVVHELLPLEILLLLLESPSDDGVEVAVDFVKEVGPSFVCTIQPWETCVVEGEASAQGLGWCKLPPAGCFACCQLVHRCRLSCRWARCCWT